jgi:hypothetical protein
MQIVDTKRSRRNALFYSLSLKALLYSNPMNLGDPSKNFQGDIVSYNHLVVQASIIGKYDFSYDWLQCIFVIGSRIDDLTTHEKNIIEKLKSFKSAFAVNNTKLGLEGFRNDAEADS